MEIPVYDVQGIPADTFPEIQNLSQGFSNRHGHSIVIDNGSYQCRAGWSNQSAPLLTFRNLATNNKTGKILVGPELTEKSAVKSPFEKNVVQHFHTQEHIFDYIFATLGFEDKPVAHDIVMTESLYNPNYCRERMAEVLFEGYHVPALNLGVDALFGFGLNGHSSGLIVNVGHSTTHVVTIIDEIMRDCKRINLGSWNCIDYFSKILQTRYFYNKTLFTTQLAQEIFYKHCYFAPFYTEELQRLRHHNQIKVQLEFIPPPEPTEEEVQRREEQKKEAAERLRLSLAKKRESKRAEQEAELELLTNIAEKKDEQAMKEAGLESLEQVEKSVSDLQIKLNLKSKPEKQSGEMTEAQMKLRKSQEAAKILREEKKRQQQLQQDKLEKLRNENPKKYFESLLLEKQEIMNKLQNRDKRTRMKVIAELGNDQEDTFGLNDKDWQIYADIQKDAQQEQKTRLLEIESEINILQSSGKLKPTKEDYQIHLDADRVRVPEILFQPQICGIDQSGIAHVLNLVFSKFSREESNLIAQNIFLFGGGSQIAGLGPRIENEVRMMRPFESQVSVVSSNDVVLDGWNGAARFAEGDVCARTKLTREAYLENGPNYFSRKQHHRFSNFYPNAEFDVVEKKARNN